MLDYLFSFGKDLDTLVCTESTKRAAGHLSRMWILPEERAQLYTGHGKGLTHRERRSPG